MLRESSPLWRRAMIEKGYLTPGPEDAPTGGGEVPENWPELAKAALNAPRQPVAEPRRWRLRHKLAGAALVAVAIVAAVALL